MNTKRNIIGEVEQMAVNAIVHQPDERKAAEKHFSDVAKKIVETAMQAIDIMEVGDVCRRAVTGAAIQDYDLLAKLMTDPDFDHERLAKAIEARASEHPIDFPTFYTPGWLADLAKKMEAEKPTDAELHEAATEEPTDKVKVEGEGEQRKATSTVHLNSSSSPVLPTLPPGADGTPPAALPVGGKGVDRGGSVIVAKTPQTVVFDIKLSSGRKISAELAAESTEHQAQAFIYDGDKPVCHIRFFNQYQTRSYSFPIVRRALNGLMSKVGHGSRYRANRKAKAGEVA